MPTSSVVRPLGPNLGTNVRSWQFCTPKIFFFQKLNKTVLGFFLLCSQIPFGFSYPLYLLSSIITFSRLILHIDFVWRMGIKLQRDSFLSNTSGEVLLSVVCEGRHWGNDLDHPLETPHSGMKEASVKGEDKPFEPV